MTTVIVDYESGNLHSAQKAFERMAQETGAGAVIVTSDPETIRAAARIVLPGDGAFPACRRALYDHRGVFEAIEEAVITLARPFMGICIGMQMLATRGLEYEETAGLRLDRWHGRADHPLGPVAQGAAYGLE
ncbi:Glutamine amidotransferase [Roseovarius mucosus DSM 17069]|uniref:Glutamine amidotransferase n=1 Tax=Roseovarius mucosus DSM 17069 TaxID=1288298 RepID=A0A0A0HLG3_9RHOB|nr:Glutamine amidotransferase [Roseovarius mucosus DSM 17069]